MKKRDNLETITLGSGELYCKQYEGTIPARTELVKPENLLGRIAGGATIEYKPTKYTAKDDLGYVQKSIITDEELILKSGLITWNGNTLVKLADTARVDETDSTKRVLKVGGSKNQTGSKYILLFVHEDKQDGNVDVMIVGQNEAGFSLTFEKEKETTIDAEFKANPNLDDEGTLLQITEYLDEVKA